MSKLTGGPARIKWCSASNEEDAFQSHTSLACKLSTICHHFLPGFLLPASMGSGGGGGGGGNEKNTSSWDTEIHLIFTRGFPISPPYQPPLLFLLGAKQTHNTPAVERSDRASFIHSRVFYLFIYLLVSRSRLGMSAEILINPAKWRLCVSDPAISQLAQPPKSDAVGPTHLRTPSSSSSAAPHQARVSTTITQKK